MSSETRMLAVEAVALRLLLTRIGERLDVVKGKLAADLQVGDRTTARLGDGTKVGSVSVNKARVSARIVNEPELTRWVAEHYPHQVEQRVRPVFLDAILKASADAGVAMAPDGTADVPGVQLAVGTPYLSVLPDPAVRGASAGLPQQWLATLRANAELSIAGTPVDVVTVIDSEATVIDAAFGEGGQP